MSTIGWSWRAMVCGLLAGGLAAGCADDDGGTPDADALGDVPGDARDLAGVEYPPPPYGVAVGDRIDNLGFVDRHGNPLSLLHVFADTSVKLLWVYATAGWCTACMPESTALDGFYDTYHPQGLEVLGVVFEDASAAPATPSYVSGYAGRYGWTFPSAADTPFVLGAYFDKASAPLNMLIDLTDMTIVGLEVGWYESAQLAAVESHLARIADRTP